MAIVGFAVVNAVTALSNSFALMLIARFCAGISAGLVWAWLVGYAARLAPSHLAGRAIAIVGISAPLAFSFGVPAGTFIGALAGWRLAFGLMSLLALALAIMIHFIVPDLPGQKQEQRFSVPDTLRIPGVLKILGMTLAFVIAHNILYTYVSPFLSLSGLSARADMVLFIFGIAGIAGLWVVGTYIDRKLWPMMQGSIIVVAVCAIAFGVWNTSPLIVLATAGLWGLILAAFQRCFRQRSPKLPAARRTWRKQCSSPSGISPLPQGTDRRPCSRRFGRRLSSLGDGRISRGHMADFASVTCR